MTKIEEISKDVQADNEETVRMNIVESHGTDNARILVVNVQSSLSRPRSMDGVNMAKTTERSAVVQRYVPTTMA